MLRREEEAMSKFYEVKKRDGAARIGKMLIGEKEIQTPLLFNLFYKEKCQGERKFIFHPEDDTEFEELSKEETWKAPRGTLLFPDIHPFAMKVKDAIPSLCVDFFILSFASNMLNSPKDFARRIIDARNSIAPDIALWVPGIATPENVSILIYSGVDIIDNGSAIIKGYQDIYQMEEGEIDIKDLEELPCNCHICTSLDIKELRLEKKREKALLIAKHNSLLLNKEIKKVKELIRRGNLREYVELRVRASSFFTASLRILDTKEGYFEKRAPIARRSCMKANTMESLKRIEVNRFAKRIKERYKAPKKKILLIFPCSAKKPYSLSPSHLKFIEAINNFRGYIHEIILTSPLGVVPRELEAIYPASFYDIPVTGYWDAEERKWVSSSLKEYLQRNYYNYEAIVAHVNGAYLDICRNAAKEMNIEIVYSCREGEKVTSTSALKNLKSCISELCENEEKKKLSEFERRKGMIKAMADYQFGIGAGSRLLEGRESWIETKGKYPSCVVFERGVKIARFVPEYGLLALTLKGAEKIENLESYKIRIGDFVPKDSILAPGVIGADPQIRVNDEVIFVGEKVFGVGRAKMNGWEMVESRKGVAVDVREIKELN